MSLKKNISLLKQGWKDIIAYFMFKKDMKKGSEDLDQDSVWHQESLHHNKFWNVIYKIVNIPQEYEDAGTDIQKYNYISDQCKYVNEWFDLILV